MCTGHLHLHSQCGHQKHFQAVALCDQFDSETSRCMGMCNIISQHLIETPSLCRECYCRTEADIFKCCKDTVTDIEEEIEALTVSLRADIDPAQRTLMQKLRSTLVEEIGELKDARNEELAEFRFQQGVWGDG